MQKTRKNTVQKSLPLYETFGFLMFLFLDWALFLLIFFLQMPGHYLSTPDKEKIVEARQKGIPVKNLTQIFGCSERTVCGILAKKKTTGNVHRVAKSGRRLSTTLREDRKLVLEYKKNPNLTSTDGVEIINQLSNKDISRWTVNRRLTRAKLFARRPALKPLMVARHRQQRLDFARKHSSWTADDWANVIFTDETKINLFHADGNHMIRRPSGKRYDIKYLRPTVKFGGGSIMLWGEA